jgi:PST family polysaccharide transporter
MSQLRRRIGGFAVLQFIALLAPFLILPIIARVGGVGGWSSIAIGQSVGAFVSGIVSYGWNLTGPARIASLAGSERQWVYALSLVSRIVVSLVVIPAGALISGFLAVDEYSLLGGFAAVASALTGLSVAWFAIGVGKPILIFYSDLVPRLVAVGLAAVLLLSGASLLIYPLLLAGSSLVGIIFVSIRVLKGWVPSRAVLKAGLTELGGQGQSAFTTILAGAYGSMPTAIIGAVAPAASVAGFAAGEKLYRAALLSVVSLGNAFQGWVAEPTGQSARWRRMRLSLTALSSLGLVGGTLIAVLGRCASGILFGGDLAASDRVCLAFGVAFFAVCASTALGRHVLIPFGRLRLVMVSTSAGAICGIPSIAILGLWFGADGGAIGFALGELVVMAVQAVCVLTISRLPQQ